MIDPELKYCPKCNDEYMPHAEKCAACELELVSGNSLLEKQKKNEQKFAKRGEGLTENDDLVIIHKGPMVDLKHLQDLFDTEKIASQIVGDDESCGKGCCPSSFYMQIRREDAQDAFAIIQEDHQKKTLLDEHDKAHTDAAFDPNAEQVMCPACGHNFEPSVTTCPDCGLCFG